MGGWCFLNNTISDFIYFVSVQWVGECHGVGVQVRGQLARVNSLPPFAWIMRIELRFSGLLSALRTEPTCQALIILLRNTGVSTVEDSSLEFSLKPI